MNSHTRQIILQEDEVLIRTRGYAAFSYADLAGRIGVTKASIHYYFPAKEDLVLQLTEDYVTRFRAALAGILARHATAGARLRAYAQLFLAGFEQGMLPYCGALSAERSALPIAMHGPIQAFFQLHLDWLGGVLDDGRAAGELATRAAPGHLALLLLSTLEGGTFVGWAMERKAMVLAAFESVLAGIETQQPHIQAASGSGPAPA